MKKSRTRNNKKGNWFVENLGQIVLVAIGIGIGIYFLWAYVLHGGGDSVKTLSQCGSLTGSQGECKEACDKSIELELPNVGCKGVANKCCVLKDTGNGDVILPTGYGTSDKYDFQVLSIGLDKKLPLPRGCTSDDRTPPSIRCTSGNDVTIPILIKVVNIGTEKVSVYADPVIVIMNNGDTVKQDLYKGKPIIINPKSEVDLSTNIVIKASDAKLNSYWDIYPYAKCDTDDCKTVDDSSRGIYRKDTTNSNVMTVKFVNKITN